MEVTVSSKTSKLARDHKLTPEQLAFADLIAVGWQPEDAWAVAMRKGVTWTKTYLKSEINSLAANENVQQRVKEVRNVLTVRQKESVAKATRSEREDVIASAMSKEQMLFDLQTALTGLTVGSKEWLDTKKMIIDVTRMKQDEVKKENNLINFHLPVHYPTGCHDCLYSRCDQCKYKREYIEQNS